MIVVCYGGPKTGSTLSFKLVSKLLEYCGHAQANMLPPGSVTPDKVENFATKRLAQSEEWARVVESHADSDQLLAIKTHGDCSEWASALVTSGKVKVIANTRDPRDTYLALRDAGRKNKRGAFSNLTNAQQCIDSVNASYQRTLHWMIEGSAVFDYHTVAFESESFLEAANEYLGLPKLDQDAYQQIINQVAKSKVATRNLGIPNRFMSNMTAEQALYYTNVFRNQLDSYSAYYRKTGANYDKYYPMLESSYDFAQRAPATQKTFVVLGCPRGGTSLVAGSLAAAGIFMGNFVTEQYEDPEFKIRPIDTRDINVESRLMRLICARNEKHDFWGWKVPNNIYYVDQIRHLLINPVFIFIYRDAESIARSSAKHDGKNWLLNKRRLKSVARKHTERVRNFQRSLSKKDTSFVFQLEDIQKNAGRFIEDLASLISPVEVDGRRLRKFLSKNGGYRALPDETRA